MRCSRKAIEVVAAVSAALATATAPAFGAVPSSSTGGANYVALGDSYSSGTGTGDYFDGSGDCLRGPKAYPQLWANTHDVADFAFDEATFVLFAFDAFADFGFAVRTLVAFAFALLDFAAVDAVLAQAPAFPAALGETVCGSLLEE